MGIYRRALLQSVGFVSFGVGVAAAATTPAPTFSVPAGTYSTTQTVTISDAAAGSSIYYTTNGLGPTTSSTPYTSPVSVSGSMKLRAIAASAGISSAVSTAVYTISPSATPTFSVAPGVYTTTQTVAISEATPGAAIYYTTSGLAPTTHSALYTGPVTVSSSMPLRAIADIPNGPISATATAVYTIAAAAAPVFSTAAGTYATAQTVTISDATPGAVIYYTTSGLAPTTSSAQYTGPISVAKSLPLRAMAQYPNGPVSPVATAVYTIASATPPVFSEPAGTYATTQKVSISDATPGAIIYYTLTGLAPTTSSAQYTGPLTISNTTSLRAIAQYPNGPISATETAVYTIAAAANPTFSIPAGTYTGTQKVSINEATAGALVYYTTNGLAPTPASAPYGGPVSVGSSMLLRAIAVYPGGPVSTVTTASYTINQASASLKTPNASSTFYGMTVNHLLSGTPWPSLDFGTLRLWDTGTVWGSLSPSSDKYDWSALDRQINLAKANNSQLIYTFGGTAPWALPTNVPIQSITRSNGVVTVITNAPHGLNFMANQAVAKQTMVTISGVSDRSFDGTFSLNATPNATTFKFLQAGANSVSSSGAASAVCGGVYAPAACAEAPASLDDWDAYVTALVAHVGAGTIQYWELWNEPNTPDYWRGDTAMLVTMAEHAQKIIKSADAQAIILSPAVTGNYETQVECTPNPQYCGKTWLEDWLSLGGKDIIDVIAFHGYPVVGEGPEQIQGGIDLLQTALADNGVSNLPMWDTESSWGRNTSLGSGSSQASWLARHLLLEESMGVQRTIWYAYDNATWGLLWDNTNGLHVSGEAYQQVQGWLNGTSLSQPCAATSDDPTTFVCSFTRPDGYVAEAVWNTQGGKSFTVPEGMVQYRNLAGAVQSASAGTVEISTSPILLENQSPTN